MAELILEKVNLVYPLLGGGVRKKVGSEVLSSAGAIVQDDIKRGRGVVALSNISLHLKDGDRVGLIGRNGSGKSTLLRVMAGIYEPLDGRVSVNGTVASMFSAGLGVKPELTGYRNIKLAGLMAGYSPKQIAAKTDEIAEFSGLGQYLDMPVRTYSNGMAMRLKFACSTAFEPEILLMDEWLGAGDPEFQEKANMRMRDLVEKAGILVLASHSHRTIRAECNKCVWMERGKIRAYGPVAEVVDECDAEIAAAKDYLA